jgi:hypothetical protein
VRTAVTPAILMGVWSEEQAKPMPLTLFPTTRGMPARKSCIELFLPPRSVAPARSAAKKFWSATAARSAWEHRCTGTTRD